MKLFVYGTLKRGFSATNYLEGETLLDDNVTLPGYRMYSAGAYPIIVPEGEYSVHGELWDVDDYLQSSLDLYEGVPHLFSRELVTVYDHDNIMHEAHCYIFNQALRHDFHSIDDGVWRPYY